jgi:ribonuclease VapC
VNGRLEYVLDSTALIALVLGEPGFERVQGLLERSGVSAVNLTETIHKLVQKGSAQRSVEHLVQGLQLNVIAWSEDLSYQSAEFAVLGKSHGLSLGGRACLTLAKQLKATAVTADQAWTEVPALGVRLLMFRS